jgi:ribose transport system substrate-binding protein
MSERWGSLSAPRALYGTGKSPYKGQVTNRRRLIGILAALLMAACHGGKSAGADKKLRIAVVPKGTTHEFWKSIHAGAVKASRELDVEVIWKGPLKEDDLKSQIDLVQRFVAQRVSGIVLAPLDSKGLRGAVRDATQHSIPVAIVDSALDSKDATSFVATDNRAAGRLAGTRMSALMNGQGNLVLLRYQEGSASTHEREEGFLESIRKNPAIRLVSDNRYAGATTESAYAASESLLLAQGAGKGEVQSVFTPNESSTFGMLLALEKAGLCGKIKFIGFDASEKLLAALRAGKIDGLMIQNPFQMGYLGVRSIVQRLRGETVTPVIDTGSTFVQRDDLNDPTIKALLLPDLSPWLSGA